VRAVDVAVPSVIAVNDASNGTVISATATPGVTINETIMTFRAGIWRVTLNLSMSVTGATPLVGARADLFIVKPGATALGGVSLIQAAIGSLAGSFEGVFHFGIDGFTAVLRITDPVNALSRIDAIASTYACRLF
jgi:hypothetical protein